MTSVVRAPQTNISRSLVDICQRAFWISPIWIRKPHRGHARSQNPSPRPLFSDGAPDRSIQAGLCDQQIAAGGGRDRRVGDRDFCDLGGAGSFSGLSPYGFWPIRGVFSIRGKLPFFGFIPYGFWALMVFFAILGRWLFSCLFRYGFWDFELRQRFL